MPRKAMPKQFSSFVNIVFEDKGFQPEDDSALGVLARSPETWDQWLTLGPKPHRHLSTKFPEPTFKRSAARDIFPRLTACMLAVRFHWMVDDPPLDIVPIDSSWLASYPPPEATKRSVRYWLSRIPERLVGLHGLFPGFFQLLASQTLPHSPVHTSEELIQHGLRFDTGSQQLRLLSHVYYCAAALKNIAELGPERFFELNFCASTERQSFVSPLIMAILISPLVLLFDTTLTNPTTLPTINTMLTHAALRGGFQKSNGPQAVLENAILKLIFSVTQNGCISQDSLNALQSAWEMVSPSIPESINRVSDPLSDSEDEGSTVQSVSDQDANSSVAGPSVAHYISQPPEFQSSFAPKSMVEPPASAQLSEFFTAQPPVESQSTFGHSSTSRLPTPQRPPTPQPPTPQRRSSTPQPPAPHPPAAHTPQPQSPPQHSADRQRISGEKFSTGQRSQSAPLQFRPHIFSEGPEPAPSQGEFDTRRSRSVPATSSTAYRQVVPTEPVATQGECDTEQRSLVNSDAQTTILPLQTQEPSSTRQKRKRKGGNGPRPRKKRRASNSNGRIQLIRVTKEQTMSFLLSQDAVHSWPDVTAVDTTLTSSEASENAGPDPDAGPKSHLRVTLRVGSLVDGKASLHNSDFLFPSFNDSASSRRLMRYVNSPQHDSEGWTPVMMEAKQALTMSPHEFQANLDGGTPIVLMGQPDPIEFDIPMLFGLLNFQSEVEFMDSDDPPSTGIALDMRAGDAIREMYHWETSRPLIITHAPDAASFYQPIERLLNTHDAALADFPLRDIPVHVRNWRGPVISAIGSIHPPIQAPNGVGMSLYCATGHVVFFIPRLRDDQHIIFNFDDVDLPLALGFEYLYEAPFRFSSFVVSPGQTVIFPPGQIYAYATLAVEGQVSPWCVMQSSYFLAAGCMKRSFFASWLDRSSSDQSTSEDSTVAVCLMAMVWKAAHALSSGEEPLHLPSIINLFSLGTMALMFIGKYRPQIREMAKGLCHYCATKQPLDCSLLLDQFNDLRIANRAYELHDLDPDVRKDYVSKADLLRQDMMQAVQHIPAL